MSNLSHCWKSHATATLNYDNTVLSCSARPKFYITKVKLSFKVRKKAKIRNCYNQVPHLAQDTIWESDKNTRKYHIQESQEVSPLPADDHKAVRDEIHTQSTNNKKGSTEVATG